MSFDIPFYTSTIMYVGQFEQSKQIVFLDAKCPYQLEGNIVYVVDGDKIISKGCYEGLNNDLSVTWFETDISESAPKMELADKEVDLPKIRT